jgi:hypothetical protein
MRMTAQFVKSIKLFFMPDQVVEYYNVLDERYNALANMPPHHILD